VFKIFGTEMRIMSRFCHLNVLRSILKELPKYNYRDYQMFLAKQELQNTCFFLSEGCAVSLSISNPK